ncbi:phosphatidyl inositol kinase [Mortierella alpina]|uniref:1-phosphatidylinositol 4-kinase n=1 Tax=Mortierella alpina TaxID=64518 RepID=A0A9P6M3H0_MORAP|nr:phosphatidyl inositol kinase [Mortierella alpina]
MPNRKGYVPLGQDECDADMNPSHPDPQAPSQQQQEEGSVHEHQPSTHGHAHTGQDVDPRHLTVTPGQEQQAHTAATSSDPSRPLAHSTVSAPAAVPSASTATATASSSSSFQFPGFGTKHRSLLGLKDTGDHTSYERLVNSKSLGSGLMGNDRPSPDMAHIQPKQHPHTTLDGPRGIQRSQRQQVLREIRPDPHNLPEELLREQARGGAAMDAIMTGGNMMQHENSSSATADRSADYAHNSNPASPVPGGGNSGERGTLLGSGDGLGLGIGLGGKANTPTQSRWSHRPRLGRRQRRVPSSGLGRENDQRVIQSSVFKPVLVSVDGGQPVTPVPALTPDHAEPMTSERFVGIVNSVKDAINSGIQPLRIAQGSSGSYFCRNMDNKIVGVFKPKNEEPLIPNLGYISESATSLVDRRLKLNIVPSTEVVWLSSPAFHYDYLDRRAAKLQKGAKPLPDKVGSFQLFLNGFKDANLFMRDHPWPVEPTTVPGGTGSGDASVNAKGKYYASWRRSTADSVHSNQQDTDGSSLYGSIAGSTHGGLAAGSRAERAGFSWTPALQQQFREQFEKMIILDYLIRNTDRGLDNWMIRFCEKDGISIVAGPPSGTQRGNLQPHQQHAKRNSRVDDLLGLDRSSGSSSSSLREGVRQGSGGTLVTPPGTPPGASTVQAQSGSGNAQGRSSQEQNGAQQSQSRSGSPTAPSQSETDGAEATSGQPITMESYYGPNHVHVAAIDNGLAFPFKHPDSWRSYPYGWLFLPRPLISQPFTKATRDHFLPLLSSPVWWRETIADLRRLFSIDSDFDQGMFDKQMAVMKGQGWNIVETLKNLDHGPMDLCRRVAVVVWDEEVTLDIGVYLSPSATGHGDHEQRSTQSGGREQSYTSTQPKAMTMDAARTSYSNYGSMMTVGDRLSTAKTLSTSSTAIGEGTPFLSASKDSHAQLTRGSLPHVTINMDGGEDDPTKDSKFKHDSFRQVVSDGEYDEHDDDDDDDEDDDAFSYEEDSNDDYEDDGDDDVTSTEGDQHPRHGTRTNHASGTSQMSLSPGSRDKMVSIDMALADTTTAAPEPTRRHQRRQSTGRRQRSYSNGVLPDGPGGAVEASSSSVADSPPGTASHGKNHRRSRTEQDGRIGAIRFDTSASEAAASSKNPFSSPEDSRGLSVEEPEPERGRSRGFFGRGYGAVSTKDGDSPDDGRMSERPKWADRLRRGLSFDGHLLAVGGIGIGQLARRERKLRKQRQRERELREQRVVLVERIEPVTKNLPYFTWW